MKSLIIGAGQIGTALYNILNKYYEGEVILTDKQVYPFDFDVIHICFPYSDNFIKEVKRYQKEYKPKYTVIHSTVPVGTSAKLKALHSPMIGIHPFLEESIQTFTKFLGGKGVNEMADYFRRADIKVYLVDKAETTELMKLLSTTKYGWDIEFNKEVKRLCGTYNIPYEAWTLWTDNYNKGYEELGYPEYKRPQLVPIMKATGGHCVTNNLDLLKSKVADIIKELNKAK